MYVCNWSGSFYDLVKKLKLFYNIIISKFSFGGQLKLALHPWLLPNSVQKIELLHCITRRSIDINVKDVKSAYSSTFSFPDVYTT